MADADSDGALGIVAGAGALPRLIAEAQGARGHLVCAFEGAAPDWIGAHPHVVVPFEKPGALFAALRQAGVRRLVMAGGMKRPKLRPLHFDRTALGLASKILPLMGQGDDALLRGLAAVFEAEGFALVGVQQVLDGLLAPAGAIGGVAMAETHAADIRRAAQIVAALGALDVGQGAVVEAGICLGVETIQGTDALLEAVARTVPALRADPSGRAGVLYKAPKPAQDRRLDLPAIGVETVRRAAAAGLAGIAVAAGGVLLIDRPAIEAEAGARGLFLHGWQG
jgi:DUF1009 family protein